MSGVLIPFSIPVYPGVSDFSFRCSSRAGTIYATYQRDEEYMAFALDPGNQADVAIACCKRAYADALKRSGGRMQARGPERQRPT